MEVDDSQTAVNGHSTVDRFSVGSRRPSDFKILIASDIHLGVHEKDPVRGEDSFNTFEEILTTAKTKDVDFILLGGDLFHQSKPSQSCYVKAISLIREHIMGGKEINMELILNGTTPKELFETSVINDVNYQDPNVNISYPIFSIHGNHDDPSGFQRTSAMHVLSANGQVNYFGVCKDLTNIQITPILIRKGRTKLALYGISHIRDERLSRLMATGSIRYVQPDKNPESWFNILVLHQNREPRTGTKWIEDKWIPDFFDLVIWGHEHECKITPEKTFEPTKHFYSVQPGSPVATSLCEAESKPKFIGVLHLRGKEFNMEEIPLKTVRPFVFHTESSRRFPGATTQERLMKSVERYIRSDILPKAVDMLTDHPKQPELPLIRLRLEVEENVPKFNEIRFGQQYFTGVVANPSDMVTFRLPSSSRASRRDHVLIDAADLADLHDRSEMKAEALAPKWFEDEKNEKNQLQVLGVLGMCEAVSNYIEKQDTAALYSMVNHQIRKTCEFLNKQDDLACDKSKITSLIERFRDLRKASTEEEQVDEARNYLDGSDRIDVTTVNFVDKKAMAQVGAEILAKKANKRAAPSEHGISDDENVTILSDDDFPQPAVETPAPKRGRGRGRGRAAANTTRASTTSSTKGRGRGKNETTYRASGDRSVLSFFRSGSQESNASNNTNLFNISTRNTQSTAKKAKWEYISDDSD